MGIHYVIFIEMIHNKSVWKQHGALHAIIYVCVSTNLLSSMDHLSLSLSLIRPLSIYPFPEGGGVSEVIYKAGGSAGKWGKKAHRPAGWLGKHDDSPRCEAGESVMSQGLCREMISCTKIIGV